MLAIKNNIMAGNAARHLSKAYDSLSTSVERLSSGLRINSAKDDAAGMAVSELIKADTAVLQQGSRNAQDGISMLQTMEGAMGVIDDNLVRMKELAEQAATGSYSSAQRTIMNAEFSEMANEIDRISNATSFNGITMLNSATPSPVSIHVGTTTTIDINKVNMTKSGLGISTGQGNLQVLSSAGSEVSTLTTPNFFTVTNAGADDTASITIQFNGEQAITANFSDTGGGAATGFTLQQVIDTINSQSENINLNDTNGNTYNYQMASSSLDTTTNKYQLKLSARGAASSTVAMTIKTGSANTDVTGWVADAGDMTTAKSLASGGADASFGAAAAGNGINILDTSAASNALATITTAITTKDTARASFGYKMNRLQSTISILDIQAENLQSAQSRIADVDVATEMATLTRTQVLAQAGISMLSQANQMPQMALSLLK